MTIFSPSSTSAAGNKKWTKGVFQHGHTQIPKLLIRNAAKLGVKPAQQIVLIHLLERWWFADDPPVVTKETLARQIGIQARQVQRHIKSLRELGLVETSFPPRVGLNAHQYTFNGLVEKLAKIAQEDRSIKKWEKFRNDDEVEF